MTQTATAEVFAEPNATEPVTDLHDGRPMHPLYRERGLDLMAQWMVEDLRWPL